MLQLSVTALFYLDNSRKISEKAMATHSSTLARKIPWMDKSGRPPSMGSRRVRHDWATSLSLFTCMHWRRNGNPLQCSCLENPRDRGAWWAAVYGLAQSQTRLKQLSSSSSSNSRKIYLRGVKACQPKDAKRRAPQLARERVCEKER